jgi:hypothetical protein
VEQLLNGLRQQSVELRRWSRGRFFRFWTGAVVIAIFGMAFLYVPEFLTWWQKSVLKVIGECSRLLPYPWSNRIEYLMTNFGASIWLQIVVANFLFRVLMSPVARWWGRS